MARRKFRDIATIAGLVQQGHPGQNYSNKHLQANSGIIFNVFQDYDPNNPLFLQAFEEVVSLQIDYERLTETMQRINQQKIQLKYPPQPTPFGFPIMVEGIREKLTTESLVDRVAKMQVQLEKYAAG